MSEWNQNWGGQDGPVLICDSEWEPREAVGPGERRGEKGCVAAPETETRYGAPQEPRHRETLAAHSSPGWSRPRGTHLAQ